MGLFIADHDFDFDDITLKLGIKPTKVRKKESFPIKELAYAEWILSTEKECCLSIADRFLKVQKLLMDKQTLIKNLCSTHNIQTGFAIKIFIEDGERPEMLLTTDILNFASSTEAEIGFDLYID